MSNSISYGGNGGIRPRPLSCGVGNYAVGIQTGFSDYLTSIQLQCYDGGTNPPLSSTIFGTNSGIHYDLLSCAVNSNKANNGVNSVTLRSGNYINEIQVGCQDGTSVGPSYGDDSNGGGGPYTFTCPKGQFLQSLDAHSGNLIDGISFTCNWPIDCVNDITTALDPRCSTWCSQNPDLCKQHIAQYCGNPAILSNSSNGCQAYFTSHAGQFDQQVQSYCTSAQGAKNSLDFCSCYLQASIDPNSAPILPDYINQILARPDCFNKDCSTKGYLPANIASHPACPSIQLQNCIQYTTFNNGGTVGGNVSLKQDASCQQYSTINNNNNNGGGTGTITSTSSTPITGNKTSTSTTPITKTTTNTTTNGTGGGGGLSNGAIVGIVIAIGGVVAIIAYLASAQRRNQKRSKSY